jgi:hypothetical protein
MGFGRWVQTDLGQSAATSVGVDIPPVTLNDSVSGVIAQVRDRVVVLDKSALYRQKPV